LILAERNWVEPVYVHLCGHQKSEMDLTGCMTQLALKNADSAVEKLEQPPARDISAAVPEAVVLSLEFLGPAQFRGKSSRKRWAMSLRLCARGDGV
jgi:hypothetical protein